MGIQKDKISNYYNKYATVKAREDVIDQHNKIRIIEGTEYELKQETEDDYTIIDETGSNIVLSKRYFYN